MNEQDQNRLERIRRQLREDDPPLSDMSTDDLLFVMRHYRKLNWRDKESYDEFENELRSRIDDIRERENSIAYANKQKLIKRLEAWFGVGVASIEDLAYDRGLRPTTRFVGQWWAWKVKFEDGSIAGSPNLIKECLETVSLSSKPVGLEDNISEIFSIYD